MPPSINPELSSLSTLLIPESAPDLPIEYDSQGTIPRTLGSGTIEHESMPVPIV